MRRIHTRPRECACAIIISKGRGVAKDPPRDVTSPSLRARPTHYGNYNPNSIFIRYACAAYATYRDHLRHPRRERDTSGC